MPKNIGFTLIELLVVIAIIAVLSVIGAAVFTGIQKNARDARRKADIDAIAKAFEVNRTSTGYMPLTAGGAYVTDSTQFASGQLPHDPLIQDANFSNTTGCGDPNSADIWQKTCFYCLKGDGTSISYCSMSDTYINGRQGYSFTNHQTKWVVCANLESGNPAYFCRKNGQ